MNLRNLASGTFGFSVKKKYFPSDQELLLWWVNEASHHGDSVLDSVLVLDSISKSCKAVYKLASDD